MNHGQVRFANTTPLEYAAVLVPFNGDSLIVNGTEYHIPLAGLPLDIRSCYKSKVANQALSANTFYYIYACEIGGTLVLNAETMGHTTGTGGIEVCSTDATQTLIGCIFPLYGSIAPTQNCMLLATWFNRYSTGLFADLTGSTSGQTWFEPNSNNRCYFVLWADEAPAVQANLVVGASAANQSNYAGVCIDQASNADCFGQYVSHSNGDIQTIAPTVPFAAFAEGFHYAGGMIKSGSSSNSVSFQPGSRLTCWWRG